MTPTVAMASEFLDAYVHIPAAQQKKVGDIIKKFRKDPTSSAINYESLKGHKNPLVRTVRIDQKYRAVVLHPDEGNVYVLMWVDNHSEAAEALFWLADGESPESVREAIASKSPQKVDTTNLEAALKHPDSRRRFVTIQTDEELTSILDAPLEKWRIFLHPSQEKLVTKPFNGPARVTGGAGTGKTVVAMHRARHSLQLNLKDDDPIAAADHEARERSLLFVAATRARDMLVVTNWGTPSPFLPRK